MDKKKIQCCVLSEDGEKVGEAGQASGKIERHKWVGDDGGWWAAELCSLQGRSVRRKKIGRLPVQAGGFWVLRGCWSVGYRLEEGGQWREANSVGFAVWVFLGYGAAAWRGRRESGPGTMERSICAKRGAMPGQQATSRGHWQP